MCTMIGRLGEMSGLQHSDSSACLALPSPILADVGVRLVVGMAVDTVSLRGLPRCEPITVSDVSSVRQGFEVIPPDAVFDFASVAYFESGRDVPVSETVSISELGVSPSGSCSPVEMTIPLGVDGTNPEPAVPEFGMLIGDGPVFIDVLPESFLRWPSDVSAGHLLPPASLYRIGEN